jgi:hypothetical protein
MFSEARVDELSRNSGGLQAQMGQVFEQQRFDYAEQRLGHADRTAS